MAGDLKDCVLSAIDASVQLANQGAVLRLSATANFSF